MMANFEGMAGGVASSSSPVSPCILARSRGARQVDSSALVCKVDKCLFQLGYSRSNVLRSLLSISDLPSTQCWRRGRTSVRAAEKSKSGFGPQPVKKTKRSNQFQPKKEDPVTRAQQILEGKQKGDETPTSMASEEAPVLGGEAQEEKKVIGGDEKLFEERLAEIKRKAAALKSQEVQKKFLPIDYDAPPPSAPADAKWTDSIVARIGIGVAVLVFGAIFALGDFLPSGSPSGDSGTQVEQKQLPPEEAAKLQAQVEQFEETLKSTPADRDALEGAGVTYAELGEYSKSATYLTKLVQITPNDAEAQRLLGEVRYEAGDYAGSANAYRSAVRVSNKDSIGLLQGLVSALVADNKPSEAVGEMLAARARLNEGNQPRAGSMSVNQKKTEATQNDESIDPVQVEMLLGKAYSSWQGHSGDAIAVYDNLIATHPDDFRGYLAKGILLKDQGSKGDAERMFIQARYLAPPRAKALVDQYSGR